MRIAVTIYPLDNLGGIVSNTENLLYGLKEIGHEIDFFLLSWQDKFGKPQNTDRQLLKKDDDWYKGFCCVAHQMKGWNFPADRKIPYKGARNLEKAKSILSKYDLIIWTIPVPTKKRQNQNNLDWIELYKANKNNVVYSHDAHLITKYPYLYEIKEYITGIASTNYASYRTVQIADVPKSLIFSSHNLTKYKQELDYDKRQNGWLNLQTYKGWKHVDDLVRAIPYMDFMKKYMAGGGLEQAYMTSKDKCKPEYFCSRSNDPNMPRKVEQQKIRIWDYALKHKMQFLGWITPCKRDAILQKVKSLIDPSWSLNFAKHGDHFNRVFTDAILNGCIPIGRNYGITSNAQGDGLIFKADVNYIMIPHDATPKEFAEIVNSVQHLPPKKWKSIVKYNYELSKQFDRKKSAQSFIDLSKGKPSGFFNDVVIPSTTNPKIIVNSAKIMKNFFGAKKVTRSEEGISKLF